MTKFEWTDEAVNELLGLVSCGDQAVRDEIIEEFKLAKHYNKAWEIISVTSTHGTGIFTRKGKQWVNEIGWNAFDHIHLNSEIESGAVTIRSIRRGTDAMIFTIGDFIKEGGRPFNIVGFEINYEQILVVYGTGSKVDSGICVKWENTNPVFPVQLNAKDFAKLMNLLNKE